MRSDLQRGLPGPEGRNGAIRQRAESVLRRVQGWAWMGVTFSVLKRAKESSCPPRLRGPSLIHMTEELVLGGGSATQAARSPKS